MRLTRRLAAADPLAHELPPPLRAPQLPAGVVEDVGYAGRHRPLLPRRWLAMGAAAVAAAALAVVIVNLAETDPAPSRAPAAVPATATEPLPTVATTTVPFEDTPTITSTVPATNSEGPAPGPRPDPVSEPPADLHLAAMFRPAEQPLPARARDFFERSVGAESTVSVDGARVLSDRDGELYVAAPTTDGICFYVQTSSRGWGSCAPTASVNRGDAFVFSGCSGPEHRSVTVAGVLPDDLRSVQLLDGEQVVASETVTGNGYRLTAPGGADTLRTGSLIPLDQSPC
jgi:hypothetical protein